MPVAEPPVVLLVDDDRPCLDAAEHALRAEGFDVRTAEDGRRGWEWLVKGLRPVVILLDLRMAGNGWAFLERQRANPAWSGIPVVVTSGLTGGAELAADAGIPPERFLAKPFSVEQLIAAIRTVAAGG